MIHCFLVDLKYTQIQTDNNVFRKKTLIVAVYVDNIFIYELDKNKILNFKIKLSNHFEMINCRVLRP